MIDRLQASLPAFLQEPPIVALIVVVGFTLMARIVDLILCGALHRLTRRTKTDIDEKLIETLHRPIFVSVILFGLFLAGEILGVPDPYAFIVNGIIKTLALFVWLGAILRAFAVLMGGLQSASGQNGWLDGRMLPLFDNVGKVLLVAGAIYALLVVWRLDVRPWLTSAGIAGLAIGFAARDSLANLFGGLSIIIDAPYKIGDYVNLDTGERGRVTKIGLRSTRLITRDDIEVTVPNAQIAGAKIVNESGGKSEKSRVTIFVGVAYGSDVDKVRDVLLRSSREVDFVIAEPAARVRFTELGDSALVFRLLCWIDLPEQRGAAIDALNTTVYNNLNAEGINIPFPQRELHVRQVAES